MRFHSPRTTVLFGVVAVALLANGKSLLPQRNLRRRQRPRALL